MRDVRLNRDSTEKSATVHDAVGVSEACTRGLGLLCLMLKRRRAVLAAVHEAKAPSDTINKNPRPSSVR